MRTKHIKHTDGRCSGWEIEAMVWILAAKMAVNFMCVFLAVFPLSQTFGASQQSVLYRDRQISFGNFKRDQEKHLSADKIKSFLVKGDELACTFKCVGEPKCFSINIAWLERSLSVWGVSHWQIPSQEHASNERFLPSLQPIGKLRVERFYT